MPKLTFTPQELLQYFHRHDKRGFFYKESVALAEKLEVHANGIYPKQIIEEARPHESEQVKHYRQKIWKPKTKPIINKIFTSLNKIRRSSDWAIEYPKEEFNRIPEEETLEMYCEYEYPNFTSVTNWAFAVLLRKYITDANAVCLCIPKERIVEETAFQQPHFLVFDSSGVLDYAENDYAILENPIGSPYIDDIGNFQRGKAWFVVTTQQILEYGVVSSRQDIKLLNVVNHMLGVLPCKRIGAIVIKATETDFLYESRIASTIPSLDEAIREYSDLQAGVVMHLYPERWEYNSAECDVCHGLGQVPSPISGNQFILCGTCGGSGSKASPFGKIIVKRDSLNPVGQIPIPPAGFVEKDVEILKLQEERVNKHIYDALASINMEHLAKTPLSESGIAKEIDRDETNNFIHSVAEDIVRYMDWCYYIIAKYRYGQQYGEEEIINMLPTIPVPEHFDIFSTKYIEEELENAKTNKLNPIIINAMEIGYASKKFQSSPEIRSCLTLTLMLDPFSNLTEDDKTMRLQNGGITEIDYIISSNIYAFVARALDENDNFEQMEMEEQRKILVKYAEEVKTTNSEGDQLKMELAAEEGDGEEQELDDNGEPIEGAANQPVNVNGNGTGTNSNGNAAGY